MRPNPRTGTDSSQESHEKAKQKQRDTDKNSALAAAGIELLRYNVKQLPSEQDIKAGFSAAELPTIRATR